MILSNVENACFAVSNTKLQVDFAAIFTAEDIGSYKPSPRNFEYMLEKLGTNGVGKENILHAAESMFHDLKPANDFGLASCWIHRRHGQKGFGATMFPVWCRATISISSAWRTSRMLIMTRCKASHRVRTRERLSSVE